MLKNMLTGQISMKEFIVALNQDSQLQKELSALVPKDARNNSFHDLWKRYSYAALQKTNFDLYLHLLKMFDFDGTLGDNLNIFSAIRVVYCYRYPETQCTTMYEEAYDLYLDTINDCFDGPEVADIVEKIIQKALQIKGKGNRKKAAKCVMVESFHITDGKRPRWIQGPEWPMGSMSPMKFLSQKRKGEQVEYTFEDIDTGTIRVIKQFY